MSLKRKGSKYEKTLAATTSSNEKPEKEKDASAKRKSSLFNRWKSKNQEEPIVYGFSAEEVYEFREAFRMFDKVSGAWELVGP